jgi:hypothetical protein
MARRNCQLRLVLPKPTPQEIEAALIAIRDDTSAFGRLVRLDQSMHNQHLLAAEMDRLWWDNIIEFDGEEIVDSSSSMSFGITIRRASACSI